MADASRGNLLHKHSGYDDLLILYPDQKHSEVISSSITPLLLQTVNLNNITIMSKALNKFVFYRIDLIRRSVVYISGEYPEPVQVCQI